ncbi:hypothetical protein [Pseudonocardia hydrocarbonoxydans]|uniref:hypothetical protein n=1 Tax=Pseudonocardia hydrocarbonoxydans TaxID=76726 RepID=UPI0011428A26|nr:hypothetical protein [Pseudonocardia hydrocarbonoxydans]
MGASDFVLEANQQVVTYGRIEWRVEEGPLLHVAVWPSLTTVRVDGGSVRLSRTESLDGDSGDHLVCVSGLWNPSGLIEVEDVEVVPEVPVIPAAWADRECLERVATLGDEEVAAVYGSARESACGLSLATAGSRSHLMVIKVLHVCSDLATWHELQGRQFMSLAPAIFPQSVKPSSPAFVAPPAELAAVGLAESKL